MNLTRRGLAAGAVALMPLTAALVATPMNDPQADRAAAAALRKLIAGNPAARQLNEKALAGAHGVSAKMQAAGVIALLAAFFGYQRPTIAAPPSDGHHRLAGHMDEGYSCYVDTTVDGVPFRMLVDTGSDDLAFNRSHLRKLRLNPKRLAYTVPIHTSNGTVRSAPIVVHELRIGGFVLHDVEAMVDNTGVNEPLLGMSIIRHMHLEIGSDGCELRW
jgi:aspartyl protease family protein